MGEPQIGIEVGEENGVIVHIGDIKVWNVIERRISDWLIARLMKICHKTIARGRLGTRQS